VASSRAREAFHIHAEKATLRELPHKWVRDRGKNTILDYEGEQNMTEELQEIYRVLKDISAQQKILSGGLMRLLDIVEKE